MVVGGACNAYATPPEQIAAVYELQHKTLIGISKAEVDRDAVMNRGLQGISRICRRA